MNEVMESTNRECECKRCHHKWMHANRRSQTNKTGLPLVCAKCKTYFWNQEVKQQ